MRKFIPLILLAACMGQPDNGSLDDATVYHWENDNVTMAKFIHDHKNCLGVGNSTGQRSRIANILSPMEPATIPKWDGLWATFESREHREVGQRIAFSVPSGESGQLHNYRGCMENLGYRLTYRR
jgi:hypothetical protein